MQDLLITLQGIIADAPEPLAALVTALAGAIPFVEGEGAAAIAVLAGVNPVVAGVFAALGNLICVAVVVFLSSGARKAVVTGISRRKIRLGSGGAIDADTQVEVHDDAQVLVGTKGVATNEVGAEALAAGSAAAVSTDARSGRRFSQAPKDESPRAIARRKKFTAALEKYGVPGVSLLGPLLLPTAITASMLTAVGVHPRWVMLWQTIAIIGWTAIFTVIFAVFVSNM